MIGRLIKLAIVVLLALAAFRIGQVYIAHYQFTDEVKQIADRSVKATDEDVRAAVAASARNYGIPLDAELVKVRLQGEHVYVDLTYRRPVELFPRYFYQWPFEVHEHGWVLASGGLAPRR